LKERDTWGERNNNFLEGLLDLSSIRAFARMWESTKNLEKKEKKVNQFNGEGFGCKR